MPTASALQAEVLGPVATAEATAVDITITPVLVPVPAVETVVATGKTGTTVAANQVVVQLVEVETA